MRSSEIQATAKEALKGHWFKAVIASFVASVFGATTLNSFSFSFDFSFSDTTTPDDGGENLTAALNVMTNSSYEQAWAFLGALVLAILAFVLVYSIIMMTIGSAVSIGYCQFNLDIIDGSDVKLRELFARFRQIGTAICAKILSAIYITLGFLLFIIPGIRLSFAYSMVNFVLAENPDMKAREALRESKRIMKRHKWKFFCLECSFILPIILCAFTLGIGFIWLIPYMNASYAAFYRNAKNEADFG